MSNEEPTEESVRRELLAILLRDDVRDAFLHGIHVPPQEAKNRYEEYWHILLDHVLDVELTQRAVHRSYSMSQPEFPLGTTANWVLK